MNIDAHLVTLAREYLDLVRRLQANDLSFDAYKYLSTQRTRAYNALIKALGPEYKGPLDLQAWCRIYLLNFFLQQNQNERPDIWRTLAE